MAFFLEVLIGGLLSGVMYSFVALGFVIIFKASGVFNYAQGAMVLVAGLALVRSLDFMTGHGVAMVEFRVTPEGAPYLMEVNTPFWGSLQLSIDAGVDFPRLLVEAELDIKGDIPEHYTIGTRLRWLLGDLDSLYLCLKGAYPLSYKVKRVFAFLTPSPFRTRHETNRLEDMGPGIYELKTYIRQLLGRA